MLGCVARACQGVVLIASLAIGPNGGCAGRHCAFDNCAVRVL